MTVGACCARPTTDILHAPSTQAHNNSSDYGSSVYYKILENLQNSRHLYPCTHTLCLAT